MRRRILVITASPHQIPVIRRAQQLGLEVVGTDGRDDAVGLQACDVALRVDALDSEALLAVARQYSVSGVITEQTDVGVASAAYVAEQLGLPGIGRETARAATNKWFMRERCRLAGVPTPAYRLVTGVAEGASAAREIGFPVVVKPVDSHSSRGVRKVPSQLELSDAVANALAHSRTGSALVEEMMVGPEASAESFVVGGTVQLLGVSEKLKSKPPSSFDLRLIYPGDFPADTLAEIAEMNERVIRAIGIPMGITHAEFIVTARGVRLIEIAARGCGARVATDLIPAITGVDLLGDRIRQAIGESVALPRATEALTGVLQFIVLPGGVLRGVAGHAAARSVPGVLDVVLMARQGDQLGAVENGSQRHGFVLATGATRAQALERVRRVLDELRFYIEGREADAHA